MFTNEIRTICSVLNWRFMSKACSYSDFPCISPQITLADEDFKSGVRNSHLLPLFDIKGTVINKSFCCTPVKMFLTACSNFNSRAPIWLQECPCPVMHDHHPLTTAPSCLQWTYTSLVCLSGDVDFLKIW
jgi:hypothetical protein